VLLWAASFLAQHLLVPPLNDWFQERARADAISMAERCDEPVSCALVRMHLRNQRDYLRSSRAAHRAVRVDPLGEVVIGGERLVLGRVGLDDLLVIEHDGSLFLAGRTQADLQETLSLVEEYVEFERVNGWSKVRPPVPVEHLPSGETRRAW